MGRGSVESFVGGLERSLDGKEVSARTKRKLSSVISACGWKKRSPQRLEQLNEVLSHAGIYADQDLLDMNLGVDTFVWFSRRPPLPVGKIFHQERAVGYHLGKYKDALEEALPEYAPLLHKSGGHKKEASYTLDGERFIPDLVFKAKSGEWLVCEIERGDPKRDSVPQLIDYMRAVSNGSRLVVGVLITARPRTHYWRETVGRLIETIPSDLGPAHWLWYDVSVTLDSAR